MNLKPVNVCAKCTPFASQIAPVIVVETMVERIAGLSGSVPMRRRAVIT